MQVGGAERFSLDDFVARVGERAGVDPPAAAFDARVVLEVVDEATTGGITANLREQLPAEFDRLFDAGSTGPM